MTYVPGQSVLHRLHPAVKLAWLLWATVALFLFDTWRVPVAAVLAALLLLGLAGVAPWRIGGMRLWISLGLLILAVHALATRSGEPLVGPLTTGGLVAGVRTLCRLLAIVLLSALFVATTEPVTLASGLMRVGLPYRWGFALVNALRLAPVFRIEAQQVYQAQLARGVAYDAPGPRRWWLMLRHLCLPLLVSALRTAQSLSLSMEGRAFGLHPRRTFTREVRAGPADALAVTLLAATIGLAIWYAVRGA